MVMLNDWTPMSGYVEAMKFGTLYVLALAAYFLLAIRLNSAIAERNKLAFTIVNAFIFLGFFVLNAYPVRLGLKFILVSIGISTLTLMFTQPQESALVEST